MPDADRMAALDTPPMKLRLFVLNVASCDYRCAEQRRQKSAG
jgi:hypothetical protein